MFSKEFIEYLSKYGEELDVIKKEETRLNEAVMLEVQSVKYAYIPLKVDER